MQHVDLASSAERMVEARQKIVPGNFVTVMARLNPWWWVQGGDAGPTLADSASGTQVGPGNGHWNDFPMPPPLHHGGTSGTNHAPHTAGVNGLTQLYQQPGATTDGRKAFGILAPATKLSSSYWAATVASDWNNADDPPIDGGNFQMAFWYKWTGAVPANNSQAGTATATMMGFSSQLAPCAAFFWIDDRVSPAIFNWAMRDSTNVLKTGGWGTSPNDGQWHLLGAIITCDGGRNQTCTLYDNGVSLGTVTLTANAGAFAGLAGELHNFFFGGETDFFIGPGSGFNLQDVAVTTPTAASPGFHASDFAALYAAR